MTKQVQDAYIVAATRTPIGKSGRGYFRNTRPDDLLIAAIRSAMTQVPTLDPGAIEDAIVGCSFPEGEQGMNMARIAVALCGFPKPVGGHLDGGESRRAEAVHGDAAHRLRKAA